MFVAAASLGAQTTDQSSGSASRLRLAIDAAGSWVRYDGFLGSGALSLSPSAQLDGAIGSAVARGSFLVFPSGNYSAQGWLAASTNTPTFGALHGELTASAGESRYYRHDALGARVGHALGRLRVHVNSADREWFVGGGAGWAAIGPEGRPSALLGAGVFQRSSFGTLQISSSGTQVGDTAYLDTELALDVARGRFAMSAMAGARGPSRGGGRGVYGEASSAWRVAQQMSLVLSGGRYPVDAVRGSLSGRYVSLALRLTSRASSVVPVRRIAPRTPASAVVEVIHSPAASGAAGLRFRVADAARVEVMGDFSDWKPLPLHSLGNGSWQLDVALPPGRYRFNFRVDGGPWIVPPGLTPFADGFGGIVGVVVVE